MANNQKLIEGNMFNQKKFFAKLLEGGRLGVPVWSFFRRPFWILPLFRWFPMSDFGKLFFLWSRHIKVVKSVEKPLLLILLNLHYNFSFNYRTTSMGHFKRAVKKNAQWWQSVIMQFIILETLNNQKMQKKLSMYPTSTFKSNSSRL